MRRRDYVERLLPICHKMAEVCPERIRIAHNEEDETTALQPEAAHFLKLDGKRVQRDIEVYGTMATIHGIGVGLADFILLPWTVARKVPAAYLAVIDELHALADLLPTELPDELRKTWHDMIDHGRVKCPESPDTTPSQSTPESSPEDSLLLGPDSAEKS